MVILGITGSVASGKSTVVAELVHLGAVAVDADAIGHEVLKMPAVRAALCRRWGHNVLDADGQVNRKAVAERVFSDSAVEAGPELRFLESVTHPRIAARLERDIAELTASASAVAVALEAALLFEAQWAPYCDVTLCVDAPEEVRWRRAERRGWTRSQFYARQGAQLAPPAKCALADRTIDNGGARGQLQEQIRRIWRDLIERNTGAG